jgi:hypothetical protein
MSAEDVLDANRLPQEITGGAGGNRANLADLNLLRLAVSQAFPVSPALKEATVRTAAEMLSGQHTSARTKIAAGRLVTAMVGANLSVIDTVLKVHQVEDLDERLTTLEQLAQQEGQQPTLARITVVRSDRRSDRQEMNGATNHAEHQQPTRDAGGNGQTQAGEVHLGSQAPAALDPDDEEEAWR